MAFVRDNFTTADTDKASRLSAWHRLVQGLHYGLEFDSNINTPYCGSARRFATSDFQVVAFDEDQALFRRGASHIRSDGARMVELFTPLKGHCSISQFGTTAECGPGSLFLLDAGAPYEIQQPGRMAALIFTASHALSELSSSDADGLRGQAIDATQGLPRIILDLFCSIGRQGDQLNAVSFGRACRSLVDFLSLLATPAEDMSRSRAASFARLQAYLSEHASEPDTSARTAGAALGVSARYVQQLFQQRGTTVGAYLRARRLEFARYELLNCPHRSITEVAYNCGFSSSAHFSTAFKSAYSCAPRDFRRHSECLPLESLLKSS